MADDDITAEIDHPLIYKPDRPSQTFQEFRNRVPVVENFKDRRSDADVTYTAEIWRKVLANMVTLCFLARDCGYVLCRHTFALENMVVVDENIKFVRVFGVRNDGNEGDNGQDVDFVAISDVLEWLVGRHRIPDVAVFLETLKGSGDFAPSKWRAFVSCNYSLMSNIMRGDFLTHLWVKSHYFRGVGTHDFEEMAKDYLPAHGWILEARRKNNSPVHRVFKFIKGGINYEETSISCLTFIRNCLKHLTDTEHNYSQAEAYLIMESYFGSFMAQLQLAIHELGLIKEEELYLYVPST